MGPTVATAAVIIFLKKSLTTNTQLRTLPDQLDQ